MKHYLLFILISITGFCGAQVPGYMGLKFSVNYDLGICPPQVVVRSGTIPMLYHNVSVDYVLTRSLSLGVKYGFMTYKAPAENAQFSGSQFSAGNYIGKYTQNTVAVMLKDFFKGRGYLAPIGRYVSFGAYYQHVVDRSATAHLGGDLVNDQYISPVGFKGTAEFGGVIFGLGRNFVIANRLTLDFGGNINLPLSYRISEGDEAETVFRDLFQRNIIQFYVGMGFLAF